MKKFLVVVLVSFFYIAATYAAPLSSYTVEHNAQQVVAPKGMLQYILDALPDDSQILKKCITENNQKTDSFSKYFIVSKANLTKNPNETYFVRPALEPYCMAFYGAHLFRYWFVKVDTTHSDLTFTLVLQGGGDGIAVLADETNGYKYISSTSHTAIELYTRIYRFNGTQYELVSCTLENLSTEKTTLCE
ncbi:MAG: hypothetical protein IPK77_00695 [Cellvibrio sp.]|nr:hypothetical protein [Cellvibrio sp.]